MSVALSNNNLLRNQKVLVPLDLVRYVQAEGLHSSFAIFMYLKMHSDGRLNRNSLVVKQMRNELRCKDNRTFKLHMNSLKRLNWVGEDLITGTLFIRSIHHIRFQLDINNRQAVAFSHSDLKHVRSWITGALISSNTAGQDYIINKSKNKPKGTVANKREAAYQVLKFTSNRLNYSGLSNARIASILGCSATMACKLKHEAENAGYIRTKAKWDYLFTLNQQDKALRPNFEDSYSHLKGRMRSRRVEEKGRSVIKFFLQLHDEIKTRMVVKALCKFRSIRIGHQLKDSLSRKLEELKRLSRERRMHKKSVRSSTLKDPIWLKDLLRSNGMGWMVDGYRPQGAIRIPS